MKNIDTELEAVAFKYFNVETLKPRNLDRLDFFSVSVVAMKNALRAAYEAGAKSQMKPAVAEKKTPAKKPVSDLAVFLKNFEEVQKYGKKTGWGFYGVCISDIEGTLENTVKYREQGLTKQHVEEYADRALMLVIKALYWVFQETNKKVVAKFLISRYGRHLADSISSELCGNELNLDVKIHEEAAKFKSAYASVRASVLDGTFID